VIRFVVPILATALLSGVTMERFAYTAPRSAVAYHQRVPAASLIAPPLEFGHWSGHDQTVDATSLKMLRPNVVLSRSYHSLSTGNDVGFLFVQCRDTIDIEDHFPPVCYPAQGYQKDAAQPHDWVVDGQTYTGTEYAFSMQTFTRSSAIVVANFIVMPDGRIVRDMDAARAASNDLSRRFWGAAQVQLVFDRSTSEAERDAAFHDLITAARPLIDAVRRGEK
jgi:hypothetical protein